MYDDYKGIYILGWFQPRGGVGSLIAPYADLIASLVKVQDKFSIPVGMVLKKMGEKLPDTHLFGGPELKKWISKKMKQLKKIEKKGIQLDIKNKAFSNRILEAKETINTNKMQVF